MSQRLEGNVKTKTKTFVLAIATHLGRCFFDQNKLQQLGIAFVESRHVAPAASIHSD